MYVFVVLVFLKGGFSAGGFECVLSVLFGVLSFFGRSQDGESPSSCSHRKATRAGGF